MKIAIASGKGGTGKTTVSVNLAYLLAKKFDNIALLDCDVEEPNCHLFFKPKFDWFEKVDIAIPKIDLSRCTLCGKCAQVCEFNALAFIKNKVLIFEELCHGCNACKISCPENAINKSAREIGILAAKLNNNLSFIQGKTRIGEAMSPPLIKRVKNFADSKKFDIQIIDSPPGTSCPFINAVYGVDYVVLVTEPTPFGFYDLKLAVDVVMQLGIKFGILINKSSENDALIEDWAKRENIKVIAKIPEDIRIVQNYSKGEILLEKLPDIEQYLIPLLDKIYEVQHG